MLSALFLLVDVVDVLLLAVFVHYSFHLICHSWVLISNRTHCASLVTHEVGVLASLEPPPHDFAI